MPGLRGAFVLIAALTFSASISQIPQSEPQAPGTASSRTSAVLLGQVIDADTGQPIAEATVTLTGRPAPSRGRSAAPGANASLFDLMLARGGVPAERVVSAANGRFVFRDLPAANYTLRAEAPGYVDDASGFRSAGGVAPVEVKDGQTSARATLRLLKQAVISGVVLDEAGDPLIGATVRAYRRVVSRFGTLSYDPPDSATTDDRGLYRLARLEPGDYIVLVPQSQSTSPAAAADALMQSLLSGQVPEGGLGAFGRGGASPMDPRAVRVGEWRVAPDNVPPPAAGDGSLRAYQTVFYSSAFAPTDATWISLRSGEERGGVDFALQPVAPGRVNGVVTGAANAGSIPIRLVPAAGRLAGDPSALDVATGQTQPDGTFVLLAVPPGQYRVIARREPPQDLSANLPDELASNPMIQLAMNMQRGQPRAPVFGEADVTVGPGEATDVTVAVTEGISLSGRLEFQEQQAAGREASRATVVLRPLDAALTGSRTIRISPDRTFSIVGLLPGRYGVNAIVPGGPWLVKEVTVGGRDATTAALVVKDANVSDVVVTLTRTVATLRGTARLDSGTAGPARTSQARALSAVAVPANIIEWSDFELLIDRVHLTRVGQDGAFRLGPMLPGEYLVAVVDETELDTSRGLELVRSLAVQATRVTVAPGDANAVSLNVARLRR